MDMINIWKTVVLQRYAKFDGRAGRAEFWWFVLANLRDLHRAGDPGAASPAIFLVLYFVYALGAIVPIDRRRHPSAARHRQVRVAARCSRLIPLRRSDRPARVLRDAEGTNGPNQFGAAPEPAAG